jgi:hypothetical protein
VEQWRASGLTGSAFARKRGVRESTLRWWSWRLSAKGAARAGRSPREEVSPITFVEMTSAARSEPVEVVFPSGVRVRVPSEFDSAAVGRLLDVLESRR